MRKNFLILVTGITISGSALMADTRTDCVRRANMKRNEAVEACKSKADAEKKACMRSAFATHAADIKACK